VTNCIDFTILVDKTDLLFNEIYDRFSSDVTTKAVFLECLEPYILNDSLKTMSPAVMKDFVDHYERCRALGAVEACITHMDIAAIDIHQVTCHLSYNCAWGLVIYANLFSALFFVSTCS